MLRVAGLTKRFGGFVAVNDVSPTLASNINPSLVVLNVNGRGTHEVV
jgi:ABC-type branched-subunit amino acid transport system ATPase component